MPGTTPVRQLVQGSSEVVFLVLECAARWHGDEVLGGEVVCLVPAMLDVCTARFDEHVCVGVPGFLGQFWLCLEGHNAVTLGDVEHPIYPQHGDVLLLVRFHHRHLLGEDNRGGFLPLADVPALGLALLESEPLGSSVLLLLPLSPQQEHVGSAVAPSSDEVAGHDAARLGRFPRTYPNRWVARLQLRNDAVGDALEEVFGEHHTIPASTRADFMVLALHSGHQPWSWSGSISSL